MWVAYQWIKGRRFYVGSARDLKKMKLFLDADPELKSMSIFKQPDTLTEVKLNNINQCRELCGLKQLQEKVYTCLKCRCEFKSFGNRICNHCKEENASELYQEYAISM